MQLWDSVTWVFWLHRWTASFPARSKLSTQLRVSLKFRNCASSDFLAPSFDVGLATKPWRRSSASWCGHRSCWDSFFMQSLYNGNSQIGLPWTRKLEEALDGNTRLKIVLEDVDKSRQWYSRGFKFSSDYRKNSGKIVSVCSALPTERSFSSGCSRRSRRRKGENKAASVSPLCRILLPDWQWTRARDLCWPTMAPQRPLVLFRCDVWRDPREAGGGGVGHRRVGKKFGRPCEGKKRSDVLEWRLELRRKPNATYVMVKKFW